MGQPGDSHAQGDRRDQEELPAFGSGNGEKNPGHKPAGEDWNEKGDSDDLRDEQCRGTFTLRRSRKEGNRQHHGNCRHILKDEDAEGRIALRCFHFGPILEDFHHDGRAAQRQQKTCKSRFADTVSEESCRGESGQDRQHNLQRSA